MLYIIIGIAALIIYPLLSIVVIQDKAIFIGSVIVSIPVVFLVWHLFFHKVCSDFFGTMIGIPKHLKGR